MIHEIKIGLVEDELLIAEKIKMILEEIGYAVCNPASSFDEAIEMIKAEKPDFVLLDINLGKEKDGIDIAQKINEDFFLPFIFLTANSDRVTLERAKAVKPYAYLVKPFTKEELFTSIEIAVNNFNAAKQAVLQKPVADNKNHIFIRDNYRFIKILFRDIAYLESLENYVVIHTVDKKNIIYRSTFSEFLSQLPAEMFFRIHRGYAIQTELIENIQNTEVTLAGISIPLSNTYRESLFLHLNIRNI
jgi:DNA-binding LytR/AlgR family response regulator